MTIQEGDQIPQASLWVGTNEDIESLSTADLFPGKTVVLSF